MSDTAVLCENLSRTYVSRNLLGQAQRHEALKGIDLKIPRGAVFGVLGPNGAGKTTTVRILSTLLTPTGGRAEVLGFDVMTQTRDVRARIGLVLGGDRGLYGRLNALENLEYFGALNHMPARLATQRAKALLEEVRLSEAAHRPVEQYSRGMKQRLHIARGLLTDPEVVFLDEPTIGLDPSVSEEIRAIVPRLAAAGKTVLLTTHYMVEADVLCDRIVMFDKGKVVAEGAPSDIKRKVSQIRVVELHLRAAPEGTLARVGALPGVVRAAMVADGMLQRLTIQIRPGAEVREAASALFAAEDVESVLERDPTLEEAYLTILG
jgi:ABC-2 type transport system ATP-binding protein